ncbi:hypothetical protein [Chryseobacterium indoltheticum]|uniref:hypothetical protein n=1 Tax=Chryseobacterium indoltheticum TaxID=254 RepID=UPI003F4984BA
MTTINLQKPNYFAKESLSTGVTVSYLPLLNKMDDLLFGKWNEIREISDGEDERR